MGKITQKSYFRNYENVCNQAMLISECWIQIIKDVTCWIEHGVLGIVFHEMIKATSPLSC